MSFLRDAAVDLVVALKGYTLSREAEIALHRLSNEIVRSQEVAEAQNKRKHSCPDWDYMVIDEDSPEFESCLCYTEPVKEWAGLTEADIYELIGIEDEFDFAEAIEAKLKEKNK